MIRLTAVISIALPAIVAVWIVLGMFRPDLGMHDGGG